MLVGVIEECRPYTTLHQTLHAPSPDQTLHGYLDTYSRDVGVYGGVLRYEVAEIPAELMSLTFKPIVRSAYAPRQRCSIST